MSLELRGRFQEFGIQELDNRSKAQNFVITITSPPPFLHAGIKVWLIPHAFLEDNPETSKCH